MEKKEDNQWYDGRYGAADRDGLPAGGRDRLFNRRGSVTRWPRKRLQESQSIMQVQG